MKSTACGFFFVFFVSLTLLATAVPKVEWELEGCDVVKEDLKLKPAELFRQYIEKDVAGEFLQSSDWLNRAIMCPGFMPGPDTFDVISKYTIKNLGKNRFSVKYDIEGTISTKYVDGKYTMHFKPKIFDVTETNEAIKSPWGYKLSAPWGQSRVDPGVALARAKKTNLPIDAESLRALSALKLVIPKN